MQFTYDRDIAAPPEAVFAALLNPEVLKSCVPVCESLTGSPADGYDAVVAFKIGPVAARFSGRITVTDLDPPRLLHVIGEGKGGAAGLVKGGATVTLTPIPEGTRLGYAIDGEVEGSIAKLGSKLVSGFAHRLADDFFGRLQAAITGTAYEPPEREEKKGWLGRLIG